MTGLLGFLAEQVANNEEEPSAALDAWLSVCDRFDPAEAENLMELPH